MGCPVNMFAVLDAAAGRFGDCGAVYLGTEQVATWAQLRDRALRLSGALRAHLEPGARIAVASENRPEIVELMFGIWAAGCVVVPVNFKLHPREMAQILDDAGAALVFASAKIAAGLAPVAAVPVEVIGTAAYDHWFDAAPRPPADVDPAALAWLFYTSGTTGRSKGAMLSHRNLMAMTVAHLADFDDPDQDCTLVHGAPMSHGSGLYIPPYVLRGARQVIPASTTFEPDEFLDLCGHHPGCSAFLAPTMVQRLVATGRPRPAGLRTVVYGGGPMYVETLKAALAAFGPIFVQLYGQGEAPMTITGLRKADHVEADDAVLGSVGYPRSGVEVAVWRADGSRADIGEIGEIVVAGPMVTKRYDGLPEATAMAKIAFPKFLLSGHKNPVGNAGDCWHRMGDCGYLDKEGRLWFVGRKAERVTTPAGILHTEPCEQVFRRHPQVARCALIGLGAPGQQQPALVVQARTADKPVDESRLAQELRTLAQQHPHTAAILRFFFHPSFPVDVRHNAKIHRLTLAKWAAGQKGFEIP